jgi:hypothetical protein
MPYKTYHSVTPDLFAFVCRHVLICANFPAFAASAFAAQSIGNNLMPKADADNLDVSGGSSSDKVVQRQDKG